MSGMQPPVLYLMLGYPGAGKTTVSRILAEHIGATHLWADYERRKMFKNPTHSKEESNKLYAHLNQITDQLLSEGKSVVFDTSFNHFTDREHLRSIAANHDAITKLVWLTTPLELARTRAVNADHAKHNNYEQLMSEAEFERIVSHLEPPHPDEHPITIDGTHFSEQQLQTLLR